MTNENAKEFTDRHIESLDELKDWLQKQRLNSSVQYDIADGQLQVLVAGCGFMTDNLRTFQRIFTP